MGFITWSADSVYIAAMTVNRKMCHDQLDPSGTLLDSSLVDESERLLSVLSSH